TPALAILPADVVRFFIPPTWLDKNFAFRRNLANSRSQLIEQPLRLLQVARAETFGEPAVDRSEELASLLPLAVIAPEPRPTHCGAQLVNLCTSLLGLGEREVIVVFRRYRVASASLQFTAHAMQVGFDKPLFRRFNCLCCIIKTSKGILRLAELSVSIGL